MQQIYGGEISDHIQIQGKAAPDFINNINPAEVISDIYTVQVKPKGSLNITSTAVAFNPASLIDKNQGDPISLAFKETLNRVATEIGLSDVDGMRYSSNYTPALRDHTDEDKQQAYDAVLQALKELESLKAL